jgi:hypothetical protein
VNIIDTNCQSLIDTVQISMSCDRPNWEWHINEIGVFGNKQTILWENIRISWRNGKLNIVGSLPKLLKGNNFQNLTVEELSLVIDAIERKIGMCLKHAVLKRLDIATNIPLSHDISQYFECFGPYNKYHRSNIDKSTLYYNYRNNSLIAIYDKIKELKTHKSNKALVDSLSSNYMRFEVRYFTKMIRSLFKGDLTLYQLKEPSFNRTLTELWYRTFLDIGKEQTTVLILSEKVVHNELINILAKIGIDTLGGVYQTIKILENSPNFDRRRPESKTRMRRAIKKLSDVGQPTLLSNLLGELKQSFLYTYQTLVS